MAVIDKQDFYWNWALAWAVNNLYYDLINVDVVHPPYVNNHRNTSFFLKTRLGYIIADARKSQLGKWWNIEDVRVIWQENCCPWACGQREWIVYVLWKNGNRKWLFYSRILTNDDDPEKCWCVWFDKRWQFIGFTQQWEGTEVWCWNRRLFTTNYIRRWAGQRLYPGNIKQKIEWTSASKYSWDASWIQFNKTQWWTTQWYFSDEDIESWYSEFVMNWLKPDWTLVENWISIWDYILVYRSRWHEKDWFAAQVRMITWKSSDWRLMVDSPWEWFSMLQYDEDWWWEVWHWLKYYIIKWVAEKEEWDCISRDWWWEIVWFTNNRWVYIVPHETGEPLEIYHSSISVRVIWVAEANDKIFILTNNGFVHYNSTSWGYNKFFVQEDMFAWEDKRAIASYKDTLLALWRNHIAVWVPDEQNKFYTMYNQSQTIWTWSRYSFWEYEWDFLFVSNDKRLLSLWVANNIWRYMLQTEDIWDMINWKLSALTDKDEVFIWDWWNELKIYLQTNTYPYRQWERPNVITEWYRNTWANNTITHIYKFNTLFKVWTEDHVPFLLSWHREWIYFWQSWLYVRRRSENVYWADPDSRSNEFAWCDVLWTGDHMKAPFETVINAYMIENENNWLDWHPTLFQLAKLNRLITTLGPWIYTTTSKIRITAYSKWIWYTYEFPLNSDTLDNPSWIWLITEYYINWWVELSEEDEAKIKCMKDSIQDSQHEYVQKCPESKVYYHSEVQTAPWCDSYKELLTTSHWVCINDKLYELAPTMPLTASLGENQQYSTQIKIELIWWQGDIICFWWWLAELFIAPLWMIWPDWEYQMQTNTAC